MLIFVANLPRKFRSKDLTNVFSEYGSVKNAYIIYDKHTHNSKGYGFVEMEDRQEAERAMQELNEREFDSHIIFVSPAKASLEEMKEPKAEEKTADAEKVPDEASGV